MVCHTIGGQFEQTDPIFPTVAETLGVKSLAKHTSIENALDPNFMFYELYHFYARQHICYSVYMLSPSRLSVCLSHGWISQKRLNLGSCNFTIE